MQCELVARAAEGKSVWCTWTGPANGEVEITTDNNDFDTVLGGYTGGTAAFSTSTLSHGSHIVVAEYAGDLNFVGITNTLTPAQIITDPTYAGPDTIERRPTQGVKVRAAMLLANDFTSDTNGLSFDSVSATSVEGGTITVSDGWVFYTPAVGYTGIDSYTYTITDGYGGSTVGTVTVNIKVDNDPGQNLTITPLGGDPQLYRIEGSGIPDRTYRLQYSDTLALPNWFDLPGASVTVDTNGVFQYVDTTSAPERYYRSVYP